MVMQSVTSSHAYIKPIQSKTKIINAQLNISPALKHCSFENYT